MQTRGLKSSNCATKNLPTSGSFSSEINQLISCYLSIALSHPLSMPKKVIPIKAIRSKTSHQLKPSSFHYKQAINPSRNSNKAGLNIARIGTHVLAKIQSSLPTEKSDCKPKHKRPYSQQA